MTSCEKWRAKLLCGRQASRVVVLIVLPKHCDERSSVHHDVFNIAGNKYRLVARVRYDYQLINIRAVLTHSGYDAGKWKD